MATGAKQGSQRPRTAPAEQHPPAHLRRAAPASESSCISSSTRAPAACRLIWPSSSASAGTPRRSFSGQHTGLWSGLQRGWAVYAGQRSM